MQVTYLFEGLPPSANKLYATNFRTGRRFKTAVASQWQSYVSSVIQDPTQIPTGLLNVHIKLYSSWLTVKNKPRKVDLDNYIKSCLDAIFKCSEIDDCMVFEIQAQKLPSNIEKTEVTISALDES